MKVLYIYRSLAVWGGIERVWVNKMNYLFKMYGYDVFMLTTCQGSHSLPYPMEKGIHWDDLGIQFHLQYRYHGIRKLLDGYLRLRRFERRLLDKLQSINPDIIVCTTADPVSSIVKVKGDIPLVVESHSDYLHAFGEAGIKQRYYAHLLKKGLDNCSCIVTLTDGDANEWRDNNYNVEVIPNMVNLSEGSISSHSSKHVILVARFNYQKQISDAIKIWAIVHKIHSDWCLDIYGEGELKDEILYQADIVGGIFIHAPTSSIFDCYMNSSLLILTSLFEPFGLVLPEAMSCGLPVVSFDCPYGPADIVTDGVDGFLVKNRDFNEFANRVCQLIEDKDLRVRMGHAAVKSSQRYRADVIMPKWKELFERIAKVNRHVSLC